MAVGDPTGADLCVGSFDGTTLEQGTYVDKEIVFDTPVTLENNTKYAIVVRVQPTTLAIAWKYKTPGTGYPNNDVRYSSDSGVSWSTLSTWDLIFKTKAGETEKDSYYPETSDSYSFSGYWMAQQFTTTSSYEISSVVLSLAKFGGSGPADVVVSIKATEPDLPSKPTNPTPTNTATDVTLDQQTVTWVNGGGATSYNVYYGTESGNLTLLESGVTDTSYTIFQITNGSPFDYTTTRYWRIDAVNGAGTTTGDEWSFTTITFSPPPPGLRGFDSVGGGEGGFAGGAIGDKQVNIKTRLVAFARNKVFYEDT